MNKALHALVYLILAAAATALYFEYNLYGKKELLKERNRQLEDYLVKISQTIEKADAPKAANAVDAGRDVSPIEAKDVDEPEKENLLEDYKPQLEEANLETLAWNDESRRQLRSYYKVDGEGNPEVDSLDGGFVSKGPGTAQELLDLLLDRAKAQQAKLNTTRAELASLRGKLVGLVQDYNKLPPALRGEKKALEEKNGQIAELEQAKSQVEEQLAKTKSQVEDLNSEVKSLKDEVSNARDETEAVKEDLAKQEKLVDQLKKLLQRAPATPAATAAPGAAAVAALSHGDKGRLVAVDNKLMFCVVQFSEDAMKELLGPELQGALPQLEMFVKRAGFQGPAKDIVGRIRLRQNVQGGNFVIADILGDWQQTEAMKGDVVFPCEK